MSQIIGRGNNVTYEKCCPMKFIGQGDFDTNSSVNLCIGSKCAWFDKENKYIEDEMVCGFLSIAYMLSNINEHVWDVSNQCNFESPKSK